MDDDTIKEHINNLFTNLNENSLSFEQEDNDEGVKEFTCIKSLRDFSSKLKENPDIDPDTTAWRNWWRSTTKQCKELRELFQDSYKEKKYWKKKKKKDDKDIQIPSWDDKPDTIKRDEITDYSFMTYYKDYKANLPTHIIIYYIYNILHVKKIETFSDDNKEQKSNFNFINFRDKVNCNTGDDIKNIHTTLLENITKSLTNLNFYDNNSTKYYKLDNKTVFYIFKKVSNYYIGKLKECHELLLKKKIKTNTQTLNEVYNSICKKFGIDEAVDDSGNSSTPSQIEQIKLATEKLIELQKLENYERYKDIKQFKIDSINSEVEAIIYKYKDDLKKIEELKNKKTLTDEETAKLQELENNCLFSMQIFQFDNVSDDNEREIIQNLIKNIKKKYKNPYTNIIILNKDEQVIHNQLHYSSDHLTSGFKKTAFKVGNFVIGALMILLGVCVTKFTTNTFKNFGATFIGHDVNASGKDKTAKWQKTNDTIESAYKIIAVDMYVV